MISHSAESIDRQITHAMNMDEPLMIIANNRAGGRPCSLAEDTNQCRQDRLRRKESVSLAFCDLEGNVELRA